MRTVQQSIDLIAMAYQSGLPNEDDLNKKSTPNMKIKSTVMLVIQEKKKQDSISTLKK